MADKNKQWQYSDFRLAPDTWIVFDDTSVTGGLRYEGRKYTCPRCSTEVTETTVICYGCGGTINSGGRLEVEISSTKTLDNRAIYDEGTALGNKARTLLSKLGVPKGKGMFVVVGEKIDELREKIHEIAEDAEAFNVRAAHAGSARRASVGIIALRIEPDNAEMIRSIARRIRATLAEVRDVLQAGDVDKIAGTFAKLKGLDSLAVGAPQRSIQYAMQCASDARAALRKAAREEKDLAEVGKTLNVGAISAAIGMFADLVAPSAPSQGGR